MEDDRTMESLPSLRRRMGVRQGAVADALGISQPALSEFERKCCSPGFVARYKKVVEDLSKEDQAEHARP